MTQPADKLTNTPAYWQASMTTHHYDSYFQTDQIYFLHKKEKNITVSLEDACRTSCFSSHLLGHLCINKRTHSLRVEHPSVMSGILLKKAVSSELFEEKLQMLVTYSDMHSTYCINVLWWSHIVSAAGLLFPSMSWVTWPEEVTFKCGCYIWISLDAIFFLCQYIASVSSINTAVLHSRDTDTPSLKHTYELRSYVPYYRLLFTYFSFHIAVLLVLFV